MISTKEWSTLASVVFKRTYARKKDNGSLETYLETVERAILGNTRNHKVSDKEIERLRYFMMNRKAGPAGRGLWFSGTAAQEKLGGVALNNCWFLTSAEWQSFVIAQDLLMLGGGVGISVEHKFTSKLPKIKKSVVVVCKNTKDADFIVPDSREGWCELTRRILEAFFVTGRSFSFSTVCVRGYGETIAGFGGTSSGPIPLVAFAEKLSAILISREGRQLRPIDSADITCAIGEMVKAGNVRRSAIIIIGDSWDKDYLKAKRWDLGLIPNQRSCANWSVACEDIEDLHPLYWKTYEAGEAFGLINVKNIQKYGRMGELRKDSAIGVNPCFGKDTMVRTDVGNFAIQDLVGKAVNIWNGISWQTVDNFRITGENQPMLKIIKQDRSFVRVTPQHTCILNDGTRVSAKDLRVGMDLKISEAPYSVIFSKIVSGIAEDGFDEKVYCCTVEGTHSLGLSDGLLWGNCGEATLEPYEPCNLQDLDLPNLDNEKEFIEAAKLMQRWGKRVTCEKYHIPEVDEVIKRNRRIGTSITGCLQSPLFNPETLDRVYAAIREEDKSYSKELGIPESIRNTTIKPSGTKSKMDDVDGEGIHAAESRYMIQRIRFAANDALIPMLREAGHKMEPVVNFDDTLDHGTMVVDFYKKIPDNLPCVDEGFDTWKQLDVLKMAQKHWSDQAVSVTVYYKRDEIEKIKEWLNDNYKSLKTISFLCHNEHGFKQAPKEAITKEQYEKEVSKLKPIDIDKIDSGNELEDLECRGGSCPVKQLIIYSL